MLVELFVIRTTSVGGAVSVYWHQWAVTSEVTLRKVYYLRYIVHQGLHDPDKNETLSIF